MGWEFSGVVGFDFGPLLQCRTRIAKVKSAYNSLIIDPRGLQCENVMMLLDLTFGPSFKVKRWFTGFGEFSFWWIQICIGSPMSDVLWLDYPISDTVNNVLIFNITVVVNVASECECC